MQLSIVASGCQTLSSISTARCGSQYVNHDMDCDSEVSAINEYMHSQHDQQLKYLSVKLVSVASTFRSSYLGG